MPLMRVLLLCSYVALLTLGAGRAAPRSTPCVLQQGRVLGGLAGATLTEMRPACEDAVRAFAQDAFLKLPGAEAAESYWVPSHSFVGTFVNRMTRQGYQIKRTVVNGSTRVTVMEKGTTRVLITIQPYSPDALSVSFGEPQSAPDRPLLTFQFLKIR